LTFGLGIIILQGVSRRKYMAGVNIMHNYIISSIIPENCIPFRPVVTEELRGNGILA
jgi:hypothetical protein